jgi:hypothetical protein
MAEAASAPAQTKLTASDVSARLQQVLALLFPSSLAAKAALFAVAVALLPSSQAPRLWELPHLLLLGIIISYGVFGQKNADAEVAAVAAKDEEPSVEAFVSEMMQGPFAFEQSDRDDGDGGVNEDGVQAWSSQYLPDDPLVVVADNVSNDGKGIHLPVRELKPATKEGDMSDGKGIHLPMRELKPATKEGDMSDGIIEEEEYGEFLVPKAGYDVRERAIPSPSSVLDADLTLSPSSPPLFPPPPPPPFLGKRRRLQKARARSFNELGVGSRSMSGRRLSLLQSAGNEQQFRSRSASRSAFAGYDPVASIGHEAAELDEVVAGATSDSSFSSDTLTGHDKEEDSYGEEEEEEDSCDEELFELATRPSLEADEVDRKAEEFIAKFRDQIRMQRVEPARR